MIKTLKSGDAIIGIQGLDRACAKPCFLGNLTSLKSLIGQILEPQAPLTES
jgi:hypothetical protein